jgi:hypothetical protein
MSILALAIKENDVQQQNQKKPKAKGTLTITKWIFGSF